ncbi:DUF4386 domain-containing protein [Winogradskyella sediminis]|uniref:DUF4386 domain-containing protein n=1 Tax=Winogradskyella sediminis TaxID=1382466 RepID=A0A1H1RUQ4_9FLAO|nr:DUF4386 domain-containing protein [Winogradskyella sediminis]REG89403.1 uncharacterized protein DUF4386 [Winogradskyella sediminis]SDS39491.1 protein of unknown function [Winogradskyella sediminis]
MKKYSKTTQFIKSRVIGVLFLLAFLFYGIGRSLFESELEIQKHIGSVLIFINSIVVLFIGFFLRKTIIKGNLLIGNTYFLSRVIEALALSSILLNLIPAVNISLDFGYFIAMLFLGIGSIPMCYIYYKHNFLPKWLALCGLIGYTVMAFGFLMELFGREWSMYLLILAGFWEVTFAIWLIMRKEQNQK